jgi:hypothetical protein
MGVAAPVWALRIMTSLSAKARGWIKNVMSAVQANSLFMKVLFSSFDVKGCHFIRGEDDSRETG